MKGAAKSWFTNTVCEAEQRDPQMGREGKEKPSSGGSGFGGVKKATGGAKGDGRFPPTCQGLKFSFWKHHRRITGNFPEIFQEQSEISEKLSRHPYSHTEKSNLDEVGVSTKICGETTRFFE